ncbi:pyruvate kinase [bacterium]|nr:pyruvate kinase [bacterium]
MPIIEFTLACCMPMVRKNAMKHTKILCTIGPATHSTEIIHAMVDNGMNAARINTSHGDFAQYRDMIERIRSVANIPIVMDTQGPKVRLRMNRHIHIEPGESMKIGFSTAEEFYLDAPIFNELQPGDQVVLDDGAFEAVIDEKGEKFITLRFQNGGEVISGRAVNFPGKSLPLDPLTEKDHHTLAFAKEMQIDFIALSFTRDKKDIEAAHQHLAGSTVKIIAKIENQQGIDNFEDILDSADGVMVARGDMGVELPIHEIPLVQKRLIKTCLTTDKLVITATQMLQSMVDSPRPTRAEVSDVANAILDGSDVVMLSGETSIGRYPVRAVRMMNRIAGSAEPHISVKQRFSGSDVETSICSAVRELCTQAHVDKVISITRRGHTAKMLSRLRIKQPLLALTKREEVFRELTLFFGVRPIYYPNIPDSLSTVEAGRFLFENGFIEKNDVVLFVSGEYHPHHPVTNTIQIHNVQDILQYFDNNNGKETE